LSSQGSVIKVYGRTKPRVSWGLMRESDFMRDPGHVATKRIKGGFAPRYIGGM